MSYRTLSHGPHKLTLFDHDEGESKYVIKRTYWHDPVLRMTKEQRDSRMRSSKDELRLLANIPMSVVGQWLRDGSLADKKNIRKWMEDPDNRDFVVDQDSRREGS